MTVEGSLRWHAIVILAAGSLLALGNPPEPQNASPKDLAKEAQTDEEKDNWEAAFKKLKIAAAQKPKDKKIAESLKAAADHLSNQTANQAIDSCNQQKLDTCEQKVKLALSYASTPRATEAESQLTTRKAQLQTHWDQAEHMIDLGQFDEANKELQGLSQFTYLFPTLPTEVERLRKLRIGKAIAQGNKDVAEQQFDAAQEAFAAALSLDPGDAEAMRGIDTVKKGKEALSSWQQAKDALNAKQYEAAYLSNQKALRFFPQQGGYQELDKQILAAWVPVLEDESVLSPKPEDLKGNQTAWDNLQWIRRLDPTYQKLKEAEGTVRGTLAALYNLKANDFQAQPNNTGIGVAFLYHVNAQLINPNPSGEDPFAASSTHVNEYFARKRAMLVLVGVGNLSLANPEFVRGVGLRVGDLIDRQGLRDLKLSSLEDYQTHPPAEDPLFQDKRPDGKSPIALFKVDITTCQPESIGYNKPEDKHSKFKSGEETVPNPEYAKLQEDYRKVVNALKKTKPGKPSKEGYTSDDKTLLEKKLEQTPTDITKDKVVDYTYQEYHLRNSAHITIRLQFLDQLEKRPIGSDEGVDVTRQDEAIETTGVQQTDVNGLTNRPPRVKSPEQLLQEAENDALKSLDEKVPALLSKYTERYYNEGEKALSEGRIDDALENFICYWYTFRDRMDEKHSQRIREVVKQYSGLEFPGAPSALP